jgi:class 3 adenylate cyclase
MSARVVPGGGAERRLVSILFADLVGFTPFAEERDSEQVRDTLTRYFDIARDIIDRYGGTIEKFIGDAVMAVWGAPTAQEDDAERAVRAALELIAAVPSLGEGIQARAGVLTGEATVTLGATNQGMVAGDIVNTASRLQSVAPPGSVLVGEATHHAASAAIAFEPAGDQILKGKQAPVPAWRAIRVVAERGGRNRSDALEAPFVGRDEEMRLLKDLFHTTGREKRLRVVSIIGPAGIGKSRLAREFSLYIDGLVETVYWHSGRSPAYGQGITFWALGEMVRERAGLKELDDEQTTRSKIAATVDEWITDAAEREWINRALLTLLGVEADMAADQLFSAWRTFFERIAANGPVALVFEDMHFADPGLLDFVDHLLEWSRGVPIYVVTLARPDLLERRTSWGGGKRNFVSMSLEPLPELDMRALLAGLVPGLPDNAASTIVARADGIPLYAVETVRTLVADGRLVEQDGVYVPQGDLTSLAVPDTLTALIAARLDRLDEIDRRIVYDAAVLGQSFTEDALAALAAVPVADLDVRLAGLVRRELLRHELDPRSPERGQYAFVQALIREVAYNTLSKKDRKKLHLAAARYFEAKGSDELAGALASHYLAAHANAGEDAESDALGGQARIALRAAAARAAALGAHDQAVTFLEQALTVTSDTAEQADLLGQAARESETAARYDHAVELSRRSLELRRTLGDPVAVARATAELAESLRSKFEVGEAQQVLEQAIEELGDEAPADVTAELKVMLARVLSRANKDPRRTIELADSVLESAERHDQPLIVARAFMAKSSALIGLGRRREGMGLLQVVRDIATEHGLTNLLISATGNLAGATGDLDLSKGLELYGEAEAIARRTGHRNTLLNSIGNIGYSAFLAGEWDYALAKMDAVLADELEPRDLIFISTNALNIRASRGEAIELDLAALREAVVGDNELLLSFILDPAANLALASGDLERAQSGYESVATWDATNGSEFYYRAGRPCLWAGKIDDARRLADAAEEAGGFGPLIAARRQTSRAGIAALEGRTADALNLYRDALRGWRSVHAVWDEALTGIDMATVLDPAEPEVAAAIKSTREILEHLGAKPYLERLDAAVAREHGGEPARRSGLRNEVAVSD